LQHLLTPFGKRHVTFQAVALLAGERQIRPLIMQK
jgi:hypothetical protein